MAIVGFAVAFSVAKVYSVKHDYTIDGNQVRNNMGTLEKSGRCNDTIRYDVMGYMILQLLPVTGCGGADPRCIYMDGSEWSIVILSSCIVSLHHITS